MKITKAGLDLIKSRESCSLKAYLCPAKVWTIGWGHTGPEVHEGLEWTQDECDRTFEAEILQYDAYVQKICPSAGAEEHSAMVSLCYNIGMTAFSKSSVARLHNAGKTAEAAQAFALWNKGGGRVLQGLVLRRAAEAQLYLTGAAGDHVNLRPATAEGEKPLSQSRSINGQAGAAAATVGTIAAAKLPDIGATITDNQDLIGQVLPYISQYWWVLALAALGFIAYSMYARVDDRNQGRS